MGCRCGGGAEHEHTEDLDAASAKSLYQYIDMSQTQALNTKADTRLEQVLRPRYHGPKAYLESDTDPQVLIKIQFSGTVKIKSITLHSDGSNAAPRLMKAYANMPDLDFSSVEGKAETQLWHLVDPSNLASEEPLLYPTNVNHLTLFIPENFGAPATRISFVGVYGDYSHNRVGAVNAVYELKPNVSDHKTNANFMNTFQPGF